MRILGIFLDTSLFVAVRNGRDKNHDRAVELTKMALQGEYGGVYTSDYVFDESVTTALVRTHDFRIALNTGRFILESPRIEKLYTGPREVQSAWERFGKFGRKPMSFTDCVSLIHIEIHGISRILSFDSGFDGLVERVH